MTRTRNACMIQKFWIHGAQENLKGYLHVEEDADGNVSGICITTYRLGSLASAMANSFCSAVNLGLASGIPLRTFVDEFKGWRFEPSGPVEGSPHVLECSSLLDYVAQELEVTYLRPKECACSKECP